MIWPTKSLQNANGVRVCLFVALASLLSTTSCTVPESEQSGFSGPRATVARQGKTIVLIHGMFMTPHSWSQWKANLEASGFHVHAPAWPLHDSEPEAMREQHPNPKLGKLELSDVVASLRTFIQSLPEKPILIGHSMGGLIAQLLIQEGLGVAGVAVNSAPPKGVLSLKLSFLKSNWGLISPFVDHDEPYLPDFDAFHYAISNCVTEGEGQKIYEGFATPESRLIGNAAVTDAAKIDFDKKTTPLLFIAGGDDHMTPAKLNYLNFKKYFNAKSSTDFKMFHDRCHWIVGQKGWEEVVQYIKDWLAKN